MKNIALLMVAALLTPISSASELEMKMAFLPLYASHAVVREGQEPLHAKPRAVSFLSRGAEPEATLAILRVPFVPHHDVTWTGAGDTNLVTACRLGLTHAAKELEGGGYSLEVTLDTSSMERPEGLELSDEGVVELVKQAIFLNFPKAAVVVKTGEPQR